MGMALSKKARNAIAGITIVPTHYMEMKTRVVTRKRAGLSPVKRVQATTTDAATVRAL